MKNSNNTKEQDLKASGALAPFASSSFLVLWVATVLSNIGTWMHDVGAGWLMASLSPSPLYVALVQTATTLPIFLFALPAGALADILDKRKLLVVVQVIMAITALALGYTVFRGEISPVLLLVLTFVMGIGAAISAPAWQSVVPSLVPKTLLQQAVALNSVGINLSRAIGPAIGGVIIGYSISLPFFVNSFSFLLVVCALIWWSPSKSAPRTLPVENLFGALRAGVRYAMNSRPLKATLVRAISFFLFASAYWALLPLVAKDLLKGDANLYGLMMGAVGLGAVSSAFILPEIKKRLGANLLVTLGSLGTALSMVTLASAYSDALAIASCFLAGVFWLAVLTSLNLSAQVALPEWVRARGLAVFVTVFFGSMSLGSIIWGQLSSVLGISHALIYAAIGLILLIPFTMRFKLQLGEGMDLSPSMHWPQPITDIDVQRDRGPVMINIEYQINPEDQANFFLAMNKLKENRRRDGAYTWGLFEDTSKSGRFIEYFMVESWLEHLRQHERVTHADAEVQAIARSYHRGSDRPKVDHYIAADLAK